MLDSNQRITSLQSAPLGRLGNVAWCDGIPLQEALSIAVVCSSVEDSNLPVDARPTYNHILPEH